MTVIDVACAADARYVPHCATMIASALAEHHSDLRVHYLHGPELPARAKESITEMVAEGGGSVSFLEIDPAQVAGLPSWDYISATMWYRVFLPELLPEVPRVLYLDADTIIVDSLAPLWEIDLGNQLVGAVTNVFQRAASDQPEQFELRRSDPPYFNSGVLLMNLELMREQETSSELLGYARANSDRLGWPDQDALNHVLGAKRHHLHPRWNLMNSFLLFPWSEETFGAKSLAEARSDPAIRHFEGPSVNKPWHLLCERGMRELYRHHRRHTPWPRYLPDGLTPGNVLRRVARRRTATPA
jgi:lipopolysaccharide biosynthesis glycosyltransferase